MKLLLGSFILLLANAMATTKNLRGRKLRKEERSTSTDVPFERLNAVDRVTRDTSEEGTSDPINNSTQLPPIFDGVVHPIDWEWYNCTQHDSLDRAENNCTASNSSTQPRSPSEEPTTSVDFQ
jgi:hypothetical protein